MCYYCIFLYTHLQGAGNRERGLQALRASVQLGPDTEVLGSVAKGCWVGVGATRRDMDYFFHSEVPAMSCLDLHAILVLPPEILETLTVQISFVCLLIFLHQLFNLRSWNFR